MAISRWAVLSALTAALAMGQDLAVDNAGANTSTSAGVSSSDAARPITAKQREQWAVFSTIGPQAIVGEAFIAGVETWANKPREFGSHWDGFGKRAGADLGEAAVSHTMEAGLGAIWGEDPRYFRDAGAPFKNRLAHVFVMTFAARNRDGDLMPAYARFIAIPSSSAIATTWRPDSERTAGNVGVRIGLAVLGRMGTNAFSEFWPDVRRHLPGGKSAQASLTSSQSH
jgi:hypothetical protein